MENKPLYYDGSGKLNIPGMTGKENVKAKPIVITDEMRKNLGGNPFVIFKTK